MGNAFRKNSRLIVGIVLVVAIFGSGFMLGSSHPTALAQDTAAANSKLFEPFWTAWDLMHTNYVDPLDDNALMQGALSGMMAAPGDKFTSYFDPAFFKSTTDELAGQFTGIGATIKKDDKNGALDIVSTLDGSPARAAGLLPGDQIMRIDDQDITALPEQTIVSRVRGASGTVVRLGIRRGNALPLLTIPVTRGTINTPDVATRMYAGNIGYISLSIFGNHASADFEAGLKTLNANKLKGLIIDLRNNPGGYVPAAISIASEFIPSGVIMTERGKQASDSLKANGNTLAPNVPLIVLVNEGTASAAEIVSGALQDYGRAKLLGTQTYGKGSAQIVQQLSNGGAAHITVAHWYTPKNRTIQGVGLTPNYVIPLNPQAPDLDVQIQRALLILRGDF